MGFSDASQSGTMVEYQGDVLPEDNADPFEYTPGRYGDRFVNDGILTINNNSLSGSFSYTRFDPLSDRDLAVFQFRSRLVRGGPSGNTAIGGLFWARWSGDIGQFLLFFLNGELRLRTADPFPVDRTIPVETSVFHTYTVVKNYRTNLLVYVDRDLVFSLPFDELSGGTPYTPFQQFQGNPVSTTEWDFVRYAIGDDALSLIPIPEPSSLALTVLFTAVFGSRNLLRN